MESYIQISLLNDFVFCPKSIYLHNLYGKYNQEIYHKEWQTKGKIAHEAVDNQTYSSRKDVLQALPIYSDELGICGKLDTFDKGTGELVERKYKIKKIYDGYKLQIYAQCFCLLEMGYEVKSLAFYSMSDNKKYKVELPTGDDFEDMKNFKVSPDFSQNPEKCKSCIYNNLCESYNI